MRRDMRIISSCLLVVAMSPLRPVTSNGAFLFTLSVLSTIGSNWATDDQCVGGNNDSIQHKMRDLVLNGKSPVPVDYPPLIDTNSLPLRINVSIVLSDLTVDEQDNLVSVTALVYKLWNDTRVYCACRNNPYNYSSFFYLDPYEIWEPFLTIQGALSAKKDIYVHHYTVDDRMMASPSGKVWRSSVGYFHFYCNLNFYLWPYDSHQCVMYLGVDGYKKNEVRIQSLTFNVAWFHLDQTADDFITKQTLNNYWQVEKVFRHTLPEIIHSSNATNHLQYALVMRIKRSSMYYSNLSHTMAIPTTICVLLSALALLLDARHSLRFHTLLLSLVWHVLCLSVICSQLPANSTKRIFVVEALKNSLLMTILSMVLLMVDRLLIESKWRPMNALIVAGDRVHTVFPWKMSFLDARTSNKPVNEVTSEWLRITSAVDIVYLLTFICFYLATLAYYVILILTQPSPSPVARTPS